MRIAVDGRPLRHPFVGIGVYTREILSRIGRDHELFIYLDRDLPEPPDIPGVCRAGSGRRLTGLLTANVVFPRWARQDAVDVFFSPRHHLPLALRNIPSVVTIHDLVWRVAPETMKPLNRALDAMLMPIALAQADRVIAVSPDTANRIEAFCGRSDVDTVMLAPRQLPPPEPFEHGRPFFLFVGTKEPRKNLPGTLDGFRRAVAAGLDHDLVLAGSDGWEPGIAERIAASGLSDRVVDLGPISSARLAGVYQACSALVLASFYEGFGIPLVEAMAHGKPVITSNNGAMAEIAGDAALFVDPANAASIARAFLKLERDQDTRQRLAANAHRRAKSFSWDRAARETVEVLATASAPHLG
ncbi:MAG: glycosyltransferase family 4 protein [Gammaproteobacteria bacterium]|nr:glycosyltransferase family 4 protein [Gammaproteobacteria bacterium]